MLRVVGRSCKPGRVSLGADAWLPRPRAAQPSPNRSDTTPIPTEYKGVTEAAFGVRSECV